METMEWTRGPVIGRGSTATVSLATSVESGELLAVKSAELSRSMFLQKEQYIMSQFRSCPYIVNYIGFNITTANDKPMYNLCMEYVPGGTLHEVIQTHGGRLVEPMIRLYTRHILQGLDYLHTNALLAHCDIKSQNVLIHKDGAKIADFGCAKFMEVASSNGDVPMSAFSGTPAFMAPEVARGEEQGYPSDVWAVGCTVIEMSTGRTPWNELRDPVSALYRIGFSNEVPEIPSCLSENGKDFLSKCLKRDPKERWTAKQLLGHPFLEALDLESKEYRDLTTSSPSCVLDQGFWDSVDSLKSPQSLTPEACSSNSPAERIKKLIKCAPPSIPSTAKWDLEEAWITIRCSDIAESMENFDANDMILEDENSVATTTLLSRHPISVVSDQEPGGSMVDDDFIWQLHAESVRITSNSSGGLENDFVSENRKFDTDNDYSYSFQSQIPILFLFFCSWHAYISYFKIPNPIWLPSMDYAAE